MYVFVSRLLGLIVIIIPNEIFKITVVVLHLDQHVTTTSLKAQNFNYIPLKVGFSGEEAQQLLGENDVIKSLVHLGNKFADESEVAEMICTALGECKLQDDIDY